MQIADPARTSDPVANNEFSAARKQLPYHRFVEFHEEALPRLARERGQLVTADLADQPPLAFSSPDGTTFTYVPSADGVSIVAGDTNAATIIEIGADDFSDYVNEIHTASGLAVGGKLHFSRGGLEQLHRWEPALRALYHGRPIWSAAAAADLVDANGNALDLNQSFSPEASDAELRAFLEVAGYVHIRGAFSPAEVASLSAEIDRVRAALEPGKGDVWWSINGAGKQVPTRINYLDRFSDTIKQSCWNDRVQRFGRLLGDGFRVCDDRLDGPMAFIKNSDITQGLGDLQWHQDDGLGGHPIMCPLMQVGVQLDHANPENGQLWVLAGSHRYSNHPMVWGEEGDQPIVRFVTEPGDVTVHYGDIFHTTPPPLGANAGRRVLYFKFAEQKTFDAIPAGAHYNDALFKPGAGGRVASRADTWAEDDTQGDLEIRSFGESD